MADSGLLPGGVEPHLAQHGKVAYIEIPARDPITVGVFYEAVFGWTLNAPDDVRVAYILEPRDNQRVPFSDTANGLIGAFVADRGPSSDGVSLHLYVDDIEHIILEVESRDLEVVQALRVQDGIRVAQFRDPGGNVIGIWQAGEG